MDVFRFHNPSNDLQMERGEIINGIKSKMWIERYRDAGEFTFVANADSGIREKLPEGCLISHVETTEIMIVENHEISDVKGRPSEIVVTGRGFETEFEQRIVGSNRAFPSTSAAVDFTIPAGATWNQVVYMIQQHILTSELIDSDNALPFITVMTDIVDAGSSPERVIPKGDLHRRTIELLAAEDLGIKAVRPGPWSPLGASSLNTALVIHKGVDRTSQVIFSYDTGEIDSAEYLWSIKKLKNAAYVTGRWCETFVDNAEISYDRRIMLVDASDIDGDFTEVPTGTDFTNVIAAMNQRGIDALASQNNIAISKAELSQDVVHSTYRQDFNVGDLITVHGDYNELSFMRVTEYVEIEDEKGSSGYPTLTNI